MKHKLLSLLLVVVSTLSAQTEVYNGTCGDNLIWSLNIESQTLTITGDGDMYNWEYGTTPWFEYNFSIVNVSLPEGLTSIGDYAFGWCGNLTTIEIPQSVTSIGESAFYYCHSIAFPLYNSHVFAYLPTSYSGAYTIPDGIETISKSAFYGCENLHSVNIPNSVTSIEDYAFSNCSNLMNIILPNNLKTIGNWAFNECNDLSSIELPNTLLNIGESAFRDCYGLTNVSIPDGTSYIGNYAFCYCSNLETILLPNSITFIGDYTFIGCNHLVSIEIPQSVTSIGNYAFYQCTRLSTIEIPSSVISIGNMAFNNCTGLNSVYNFANIPQSISISSFGNVDKSICMLYVPALAIEVYENTDVWKDFENIVAIPGTEETELLLNYLDFSSEIIDSDNIVLTIPAVPKIEGFHFLKWRIVEGDLEDGINVQAVYEADVITSMPLEITNPNNPSQKLIREGNVYILQGENTYTLTGQKVILER